MCVCEYGGGGASGVVAMRRERERVCGGGRRRSMRKGGVWRRGGGREESVNGVYSGGERGVSGEECERGRRVKHVDECEEKSVREFTAVSSILDK